MLNLFSLPVSYMAKIATHWGHRKKEAAPLSAGPHPRRPQDAGREAKALQKPVKVNEPSSQAGNFEAGSAQLSALAWPAPAVEPTPLLRPGSIRDPLILPDEILSAYAEEYQHYAAPWKHLVGVEVPNFFQFVVWHERILPASRMAAPMPGH